MFNCPEGCRNDMDAPWNGKDEETKICRICGGEMIHNNDEMEPDFICQICGFDFLETNVPLCGMCGDHLPVIKNNKKGFRAECECGFCTPFRPEQEDCLADWRLLN